LVPILVWVSSATRPILSGMDNRGAERDTAQMLRPGESRRRMASTLNAAYGDGLLSQETLVHRLDLLFRSALVDPGGLVGDLTFRPGKRTVAETLRQVSQAALRAAGLAEPDAGPSPAAPTLLALDWSGIREELLLGRHHACDVVLADISVSRRHARLSFRDGNWVLRDLDSTNGTTVNGERVVRCRLLPGDELMLGDEYLLVD
jgi:FHA domain-containing protein